MMNSSRGRSRRGLSVAFFSGNVCCGRIDPRPDSAAAARSHLLPHRSLRRTKDSKQGTLQLDQSAPIHRPEREHADRRPIDYGDVTGGADWICAKPDHWVYAGTGMKAGDAIPGLIGWEWHGDPADIPGLEILATGPTTDGHGHNQGTYTATIYPGPRDNIVFNASSCWWADGLSEPPGYIRPSVYTTPKGPDPRVQRITANVLERMRGRVL